MHIGGPPLLSMDQIRRAKRKGRDKEEYE
jgi:hypothetical protein